MEQVLLLDVCNVYQPQTISTKQFVPDGKYIVYGANGPIGRYSAYNHESSEVLMACRGATCGAINVSAPFSWINGNAMVIQPNGRIPIIQKYLQYFMQYVPKNKIISGTAQPQITRQNLKDFHICICDVQEQERIVARIEEMFSQLDAGVETLKKTKAQLAVYRQAVIEDAIKSARDYGAAAKPFGEYVSQYQNGISKRSGEGTSTPVLRLADIDRQRIYTANGLRNIGLSDVERSRYLLNKEDLLIIRVNGSENNVGRSIIVNVDGVYAACDHFIRCTVDRTKLLTEYAQLLLDSFSARKFIKDNMVSSAGQNTVSQTTMNGITVYVPEVSIQNEIMITVKERLSVCESIEQTVDTALQQADAMRQSVLKDSFEGRL